MTNENYSYKHGEITIRLADGQEIKLSKATKITDFLRIMTALEPAAFTLFWQEIAANYAAEHFAPVPTDVNNELGETHTGLMPGSRPNEEEDQEEEEESSASFLEEFE